MPEIVQTYMSSEEIQNSDTPQKGASSTSKESPTSNVTDSNTASNSNSAASDSTERRSSSGSRQSSGYSRSHSHHSGSRQSSTGKPTRHKPRKSQKRSHSSYKPSFWSRISAPILQCRRCGERYRASWTQDKRCPKCGRHPLKVQPWESALYTLVLPAAVIGALVHFRRSPRNAAMVSAMGVAGFIVEGLIYLVAK